MLNKSHLDTILTAEAKVLATTGRHGVNAVPVSAVNINNDKIYLYNFFMGKTIDNLIQTPAVALTVWSGLVGLQIKAMAVYVTEGEMYNSAKIDMKQKFPDRVLSGVIVLTPTTVYNVSTGQTAGQLLAGG